MRALGQLSRHDLPVLSGAGPCQLPEAGGTAPWGGPGSEREEEDEDQEQHPQQHCDGTPLSAGWGQEGQRAEGQKGGSTPWGQRSGGRGHGGGAAPPSLPHPRGLTTGHVGYFGHLPKDPIHPGLGVAHLLSKGIQHAAETRKASAPRGSVHTGAAGQGLLAHPQGPGLTCPARPAPPQRGRTCVSELRCSQTPFPAVDPAGPGSAAG